MLDRRGHEAALLDLFEGGRRGEAPSREALLSRLYPALQGFLRGRLTTTPALQGWLPDIVQEAMIRIDGGIWRCEFAEDRALIAWCLTVARHTTTDFVRANIDRAAELILTSDLELLASRRRWWTSSWASPADFIGTPGFRAALNEVLDKLDDEEHILLWSRIVEGGSWGDVAGALRISAGAAKRRWQRLSARLETSLAEVAPINSLKRVPEAP